MILSCYMKRMLYIALNIFKTRFIRLTVSINPTTNINHILETWIQIKDYMLLKLMKTSRILTMITITFKTGLMLLTIYDTTKITHNTAQWILIKLMEANRILITASLSHTTKIMVLSINPTFTWIIIKDLMFMKTTANKFFIRRIQIFTISSDIKLSKISMARHQNAKHDVHQQYYYNVNPHVHHYHPHQHAHHKELLEITHHALHQELNFIIQDAHRQLHRIVQKKPS